MPGRGFESARYAFVADTPTWIDERNGFILSDRKLVSILHNAGLAEEDCFFTSMMKCRSDSDPTEDQISSCLGFILQELSIVQPKVIFAMGKIAFDVLSRRGGKDKIGKLRGRIYDVEMPWGTVALIPTWSVGYAKHKTSAAEDIIADVMTGIARMAPARETNYEWVNDPVELISRVDNILNLHRSGKLKYGVISVDTETTNLIKKGITPVAYPKEHNIGTIQVGWNPGEAIIFPVIRPDSAFNNPYNIVVVKNQLQRLLSEIPVVGTNYKFDEAYFNVKLGVKTEKFLFDAMLAHHFIYGGSLPNNLGFMTSRHLGWESHKRIIDDALEAMPEENRRYSLLPIPLLTEYGCKDVDSVLQLYPIFRERMEKEDYKRFNTTVVYPNMWEAFQARTMKPWRAILDIERRGARVDMDQVPAVTEELEKRMDEAFEVVSTSPPHAVWLLDHTVANPKRKVFKKAAAYYLKCSVCNNENSFRYEGKRPKMAPCPSCGNSAKVTWKMEPTSEFTINEAEPEFVITPINLKSPKQVTDFFYSRRYLGFPVNEELGQTTDKNARAWLLEQCEQAKMDIHSAILLAIGDYNKASKLYSSYATKLPEYIFITDPNDTVSKEVTAQFEENTGLFHIHTNYFQDGTCSGRLSTRAPSLHTIPRKSSIKKLFISRYGEDGLIGQGDLSQAEVRAFVIETGDEYLRDSFIKGLDPYESMASKTFNVPIHLVTEGQRQDNKSIVLGLLFGRGAAAIAKQTGKAVEEIREIIFSFFQGMPKLKRYIELQHDFVDKWKLVVSRFGRIRPLIDEIDSDDDEMLNHAHNISVNHPIQGMVGDLCIDSVARMEYAMRQRAYASVIFNTVHDSTILDIYIPELLEVMPLVKEEMYTKLQTYFPWINVPFAIDQELGLNWGSGAKASVQGNRLTLSGSPSIINPVMGRIAKHFVPSGIVSDAYKDKSGSPALKFSCDLAKR